MEKVEDKVEEKKENIYKPKVDNPLQRSIWVSNLSPMVSFLIFLKLLSVDRISTPRILSILW
jgi:hypothetical protein